MTQESTATHPVPTVLPRRTGLGWALVGVLGFSFTVPLTRVATGGLDPLFVGCGRAVVAAVLAGVVLAIARARPPRPGLWVRLAVVAAGVVVGFPLLTSYALTTASAAYATVVIGVLPAMTAVAVVLRTGERPPRAFGVYAALGAGAAVVFALTHGGGAAAPVAADVLLGGAVVAAAVGYAEGGMLARELGAWQTVSWALVLAAPPMLALAVLSVGADPPVATPTEWAAFAYLAVVSMFLAVLAWYRGLAIGPMAQVSQVQLVQPVLGILWAALLLGESVGWATVAAAGAVVLTAGLAVRARRAGENA